EDREGFFDAAAELVAGAGSFFSARLAPGFERAFGDRLLGTAEAGLVGEEPEGGEVGVELFGEDAREVRFDPRGAGEARVVAQDAQGVPVGREAPEGAVLGVEVLLREAEGAPAAAAVAEVRREGVETARRRRDDDGHAALERAPADRIAAL